MSYWMSASANRSFKTCNAEAFLVTAEHPAPSLPDPDDEPIIAAALAGNAEVFVTGDKVLLELQSIEGMPIISPRRLWELLAGHDEDER